MKSRGPLAGLDLQPQKTKDQKTKKSIRCGRLLEDQKTGPNIPCITNNSLHSPKNNTYIGVLQLNQFTLLRGNLPSVHIFRVNPQKLVKVGNVLT